MASGESTWVLRNAGPTIELPKIRASVLTGPDAGNAAEVSDGRLLVGTADTAHLRLTDSTVSRFHLELEATASGVRARDLGSTNGSFVGALRVEQAVLSATTELTLGRTRLRIEVGADRVRVPTHPIPSFGGLVGQSPAMRALFEKLTKASRVDATVLITGESGTGKEVVARSVHLASPRQARPFEVIDCGALPPSLIESELFGHVRGAFTGATHDHEGAFVRASGGTLFMDELGELPLDLQPKLLRAIADRRVRPVGGKTPVSFDVRIVAATNRDLRQLVNQGRFRANLYYRLAVVEVHVPALRERVEDLALLVPALLEELSTERGLDRQPATDALLAELSRHDWPGNVRELRNYLERMLVFDEAEPIARSGGQDPRPDAGEADLFRMSLRQAKGALVERFERRYLEALLKETGGNVAEAARKSGVDRGTLFRMMRRHRVSGSLT